MCHDVWYTLFRSMSGQCSPWGQKGTNDLFNSPGLPSYRVFLSAGRISVLMVLNAQLKSTKTILTHCQCRDVLGVLLISHNLTSSQPLHAGCYVFGSLFKDGTHLTPNAWTDVGDFETYLKDWECDLLCIFKRTYSSIKNTASHTVRPLIHRKTQVI